MLPGAFDEGGRASAQLGGGGRKGLIQGGVELAQVGPCFRCLLVENDVERRDVGECVKVFGIGSFQAGDPVQCFVLDCL